MPKRKKYPKLPNGYGSIRYLGKGRRNPYAVHPPTTEFTLDGQPMVPKALCYVDDWIKGFTVLTAYKAGTYTPGMEKTLEIKGMMCPHCEATVRTALEALPQVQEAQVSHQTGTAVVTLTGPVEDDILRRTVEDKGYTVTAIR